MSMISKNLSEVEIISIEKRRERVNEVISKDVYAGCVVLIKDLNGGVVSDKLGNPLKYQVISVYSKQARVKLVTSYGEEIGMYNIEDVVVTDDGPLFKMEDYDLEDTVIWSDYDNVYEGKISQLHTSMAEISNVKKLYPLDLKRKIPYYKLSKKSDLFKDSASNKEVLTTMKEFTISDEKE